MGRAPNCQNGLCDKSIPKRLRSQTHPRAVAQVEAPRRALDRQADRKMRPACRRPPSPASCGATNASTRWTHPHRHQKTRVFQWDRHRIPGDRTGQSNHSGGRWELAHVCINDSSRRAFAEIMPNEKHANAVTNLLLHHGGQRIGWIKRAGSQAPLSVSAMAQPAAGPGNAALRYIRL